VPVAYTYPGIYIQELPSNVHTITAASTNVAVFIGYTHPLKNSSLVLGAAEPTPRPQQLFGFSDYVRQFGGFVRSQLYSGDAENYGDMATAVNQFFLNGGTQAWVVGLQPQDLPSAPTLKFGTVLFTAREVTDDEFQLFVLLTPNFPPGTPGSPPEAPLPLTSSSPTGQTSRPRPASAASCHRGR
jgi:uncharacterized protein